MNGERITEFLEYFKDDFPTEASLAKALGLSKRWVQTWKTKEEPLDYSIVKRFKDLLERSTELQKRLQNATTEIYNEAVHCEVISIWLNLVASNEIVLTSDTSRHEISLFSDIHNEKHYNDQIRKRLRKGFGLTCYTFQSGTTLNLSLDAIKNHSAKAVKNSVTSTFLHEGLCKSLLKIPVIMPSIHCGHPIVPAIVSLENKIENDQVKVKIDPNEQNIFDRVDEEKVKKIFSEQFNNKIKPLLEIVDYLAPAECENEPQKE